MKEENDPTAIFRQLDRPRAHSHSPYCPHGHVARQRDHAGPNPYFFLKATAWSSFASTMTAGRRNLPVSQ